MRGKLQPVATRPGFITIEAVDSIDGGMCLVIGSTRVDGAEPSLAPNNIRYRWNVRKDRLLQVVAEMEKGRAD